MDQIIFFHVMYLKKNLASSIYYIIIGKSISKYIEHIKEGIADFRDFKEDVGMNEIIWNKIQTSISLWREDFETVI